MKSFMSKYLTAELMKVVSKKKNPQQQILRASNKALLTALTSALRLKKEQKPINQ